MVGFSRRVVLSRLVSWCIWTAGCIRTWLRAPSESPTLCSLSFSRCSRSGRAGRVAVSSLLCSWGWFPSLCLLEATLENLFSNPYVCEQTPPKTGAFSHLVILSWLWPTNQRA